MWSDFAIWESSRGYADDPSASSRDALVWVRELDELVAQLDDFDGAAKEELLERAGGSIRGFRSIGSYR